MTAEELNAIRKRAKDSISRMANDDEPGILPVRVIHEDVPALCDEVERLQKQLQPQYPALDWLPDLANQCAYEIHRVIGNNIEHYRGQTAKELQSLIRAAIARNSNSE